MRGRLSLFVFVEYIKERNSIHELRATTQNNPEYTVLNYYTYRFDVDRPVSPHYPGRLNL